MPRPASVACRTDDWPVRAAGRVAVGLLCSEEAEARLWSRRDVARRTHARFGGVCAAAVAALAFNVVALIGPASAGAQDPPAPLASCSSGCTWQGTTPGTTAPSINWATATNWSGLSAPAAGSNGSLTFPNLSSCPSGDACYTSNNDLTGVSVDGLTIDDRSPYNITGNGFTLGASGLSTTANGATLADAVFHTPIALGTDQAWSITGGTTGSGTVDINGGISGASQALTVNFPSRSAGLNLLSDVEVGSFTAFAAAGGLGHVGLSSGSSLNGTNGNPVAFAAGASLFDFASATVGPLTVTGGSVNMGTLFGSQPVLSVAGAVGFNSTSSLFAAIQVPSSAPAAGVNYSQLSASGDISLGGARLTIGEKPSGSCSALTVGDTYTAVKSTGGSLSGAFSNAPEGTILSASCFSGTVPRFRIHYTSTSVTATVVAAPTISTSATSAAAFGSPISDTATVSGGSSPSGNVTFEAYPNSSCSGAPSYTNTADLSGGSASSGDFTPTAAGTYYWTATYNGDSDNESVASGCGAPGEISTVSADTTAPTVTLTAPADGSATNDASPAFAGVGGISAGDGSSVTVKIWSGSSVGAGAPDYTVSASVNPTTGAYSTSGLYTRVSDSQSVTTLPDGSYTGQAFQSDASSNTGQSSATPTFLIDTQPLSSTDDVPGGWVNQHVTVTLTAGDTGGSGVDKTYYTTGAAPADPTTGSSVYDSAAKPVLADGEQIKYFSTDTAGNAEGVETSPAAQVDKLAPGSSASAPATSSSTAIRVDYTASDGGSGLATVDLYVKRPSDGSYAKAATDSSPAAPGGHFDYTAAAGGGDYAFYTLATDKVGNVEPAPAGPDATTTLSTPTVTAPGTGSSGASTATVTASGTGGRPTTTTTTAVKTTTAASAVPGTSCAASSGFNSAPVQRAGQGLQVSFSRAVKSPVTVDVFQLTRGREITGNHLVARFEGRTRSFTWNGRPNRPHNRIRDGYYFVRFRMTLPDGHHDERRVAEVHRHGRFTGRPRFYRRTDCGEIRSYKLEREVFGGSNHRSVGIAYRLRDDAQVTVTVSRGKHVVRRWTNRAARQDRTYRLRLAPDNLRRGDYRVHLSAVARGITTTAVLTTRMI